MGTIAAALTKPLEIQGDIEKLHLNYLCFMGEAHRDLCIKKGRKQICGAVI